jgi:acyl carrier protein
MSSQEKPVKPQIDAVTIASNLERFLRERFQISEQDPRFDHEVNLWDAGYVDSYGTAEVIVYLEDTFGVQLPEDALSAEENTCVEGLASLVCKAREKKADGEP